MKKLLAILLVAVLALTLALCVFAAWVLHKKHML